MADVVSSGTVVCDERSRRLANLRYLSLAYPFACFEKLSFVVETHGGLSSRYPPTV